jgi:hypothetical protein
LGIEPSFAKDGISGFWQARRNLPTVIVSDFFHAERRRRVSSGETTTPETKSIPVIVHSGRQLNEATKQRLQQEICGQPGASMILRKSFQARELFGTLEQCAAF